jgi:hypothetical protein
MDLNLDCWVNERGEGTRPTEGLCFGSRFLAASRHAYPILPESYYQDIVNRRSVWLALFLDYCGFTASKRTALFCKVGRSHYEAAFVKHGNSSTVRDQNSVAQLMACAYPDKRIYPCFSPEDVKGIRDVFRGLDTSQLLQQCDLVPEEWTSANEHAAWLEQLNGLWDRKALDWWIDDFCATVRQSPLQGLCRYF